MTNTKLSLAADTDARAVMAVIDDLLVTIAEENRALANGMPASLASSVQHKTDLADYLDAALAAIRAGTLSLGDMPPRQLAALIERLSTLCKLMSENTSRIHQAMDASRRRIDAIMRALRDTPGQVRTYGPNAMQIRTARDVPGDHWA